MIQKIGVLLLATFLHHAVEAAIECPNVDTAEGPRTLQHGEAACAPLEAGETQEDEGKRFVTCSQGTVYIQQCGAGLRYDIIHKTCNWQGSTTCRQDLPVTEASTLDTSSYTQNATAQATNAETIKVSTTKRAAETPSLGTCSSETCKIPSCFCYGASPNIPLIDTPMFIMLTFDDAVTTTVFNPFFKSLLVDNSYNIRNPNGCSIRSAFYVNHDYTNYDFVKILANIGNEIASHTVNHSLPSGELSSDLPIAEAEIVGMRDKVLQGTGDKAISDSLVGFRAPYLRVAYNVQFEALLNKGFLYDTSITNIETTSGRPPLWPYTLDYVMPTCTNVPCPSKPFPGLWEVPINGLVGSTNYGCSMVDVCTVGTNVFTASEEEWYTFYKNNFENYFYPVKVPMHLFTHGSMFLRSPPSFPALVSWFQDLQLTRRDVWMVTPKMVIEWMQNPLTNSQMIAQRWGC